ncbi:hypothetical protein Tco_0154060 [Tanacetum coccineum]
MYPSHLVLIDPLKNIALKRQQYVGEFIVDHSAQILTTIQTQIPAMVDDHLNTRIGYATQTALQSYTTEFEKKAQAEKERYIDLIEKSIKD